MEEARQYSTVTWLLLLVGLVGAPVFAGQIIKGLKTGVARGTTFDVDRRENPVVFWMAIFLNAMFVFAGLWFLYEAFVRLTS